MDKLKQKNSKLFGISTLKTLTSIKSISKLEILRHWMNKLELFEI